MVNFRRAFRSFSVPNFRLFFMGQLVSQAGTWMQSVAIIWVVLQLTEDGLALGLVTAAQFLPVLLFGAWGGVVADRTDRRRVLVATQTAYTAVAVCLSVLIFSGLLTLVAVYILASIFGSITAIDTPARRTFLGDLVGTEHVSNAVALNSALTTGSRVIGPAIAGALITGVGVEWCFVLNGVTYLAVLGALVLLDTASIHPTPHVARATGQVREGFRHVWQSVDLRVPVVLLAVVSSLAFQFEVTLPLFAGRVLDGSVATFTSLYSVMSAGSVIGALVVGQRRDVDISFLGLSSLGLAAAMTGLSLSTNVAFAALAALGVGALTVFMVSGTNAAVYLHADPMMRGRALALLTVVFLGSRPIGGPVAGWASERLGARAGILIGAGASATAGLWALRQSHRATARASEMMTQ